MTRTGGINLLRLSAAALGLFAFSSPMLAADEVDPILLPVEDIDPILSDAAKAEAIQTHADGLRELFEAASRDGLVKLKSRPGALVDQLKAVDDEDAVIQTDHAGAVDCLVLAPLFDGGQTGFADGLFTELTVDQPETAELARTLSQLISPDFAGEALPIDLTSASNCGASFLPWQALADPARVLDAETEARLTGALSDMKPALRRQLGVQIATRAALADNMRLARRIVDMLGDAGLHGQARHRADVEHVLLDALMKRRRDPVGARARLSWIAERDGPEQLLAIELLQSLDAAGQSQAELMRLRESPDPALRQTAHRRLLDAAITERDFVRASALFSQSDDVVRDAHGIALLHDHLAEAVLSDDPMTAIHALDLYERLDMQGVAFAADLRSQVAERIRTLSVSPGTSIVSPKTSSEQSAHKVVSREAAPTATPDASAVRSVSPGTVNGRNVVGYIDTLSDDIAHYKEVLGRG